MTFSTSAGFCALLLLSLGGAFATNTLNLGKAGEYAILAKAGISTVPDADITGDIAVSPIAATFVTGFSLTADSGNAFSTSDQVTGRVYAADYFPPTPSKLTTAVSNMEAAYTDAAGRANPDAARHNVNTGDLPAPDPAPGSADLPMTPGVYTFTSSVTIKDVLEFDGGGDANAIFIIQMTGDLKLTAEADVQLKAGAKAENLFWQVAGAVGVAGGAKMQGIILCKTAVIFGTGSSLTGRIMAQTHVELLKETTITQPN
jgi:hypothetical protein